MAFVSVNDPSSRLGQFISVRLDMDVPNCIINQSLWFTFIACSTIYKLEEFACSLYCFLVSHIQGPTSGSSSSAAGQSACFPTSASENAPVFGQSTIGEYHPLTVVSSLDQCYLTAYYTACTTKEPKAGWLIENYDILKF